MNRPQEAAIITVGSELVEGLRVDTHTAEIARDVSLLGFTVAEAVSIGDNVERLAEAISRLTSACALVIVTGGLGPTHDDVTREAASRALGLEMRPDSDLLGFLEPFVARHTHPSSREQVLTQALVLDSARILQPTTGTAAGQIVPTDTGQLVLLPGPPSEMRPMLREALASFTPTRAGARELGVTGMPESDVQHTVQNVLEAFEGIQLTVLAKPGDVRVILLDSGAGEQALAQAASDVAAALGEPCYSLDGSSLAEVVVAEATARGVTIALAESCTGGMVAAALTDVPGSSAVFLGGVVAYSNKSKSRLLDVDPIVLQQHGAVSQAVAELMAIGARDRFGADVCVSVTGIAGPDGGTAEKPVGTVWFGVQAPYGGGTGTQSTVSWPGASRASIRARATSLALNLIRLEVLKA
jgi:nicotinamide-nucleotide amidase